MKSLQVRAVRSLVVVALGVTVLAGCTGRGGGHLPPDGVVFAGPASFGFSFSCERSSNSPNTNPPAGRLRLALSYIEHGLSAIGSPFAIHGTADEIDPVVESAICIGQEPPPGGNELIILGRYRLAAGSPAAFPRSCSRDRPEPQQCRFEVIVRDNDRDRSPSSGDFFSIKLTTVTDPTITEFDVASVFYARAGLLDGGNVTVD